MLDTNDDNDHNSHSNTNKSDHYLAYRCRMSSIARTTMDIQSAQQCFKEIDSAIVIRGQASEILILI